jgi:hypothetical protein
MPTQILLTGFTQYGGFRYFKFERIAADRTRSAVTVKASLELARSYGIRVQELPLLCRQFLEERGPEQTDRNITYGADGMKLYAEACKAAREAAAHRKPPVRRPPVNRDPSGWGMPTVRQG